MCGLGGAGKTSVALEYAHRHLAEVGLTWQFQAEDPSVLAAGFGELAAQLGVREMLDTRDPVASVHGVLAAYRTEWLLVFDNAPSRTSVQAFVPPAGQGRVLITSRDQIWPRSHALEVPVLDQHVAAEFLANRTGDTNEQAAWDLASELGGLPLALEQAAAYIQASGDSLAGYLSSFQQRRADLLSRGEPIGYRQKQTVATTWRLAFEDLQQAAPGAVGLVRLLAFCAPDAIPLRLLLGIDPGLAERLGDKVAPVLAPLLGDPLAVSDAIGALRRYSLVTKASAGAVSVHRLIQAVTADQMPAELARQWQQAAAALIDAAIPGDTDPPETWQVCATLLPHAQAALTEDSGGMARIANYLGASGNYAAARDLLRNVVDARERVLGPEHPDTLSARANLASWTGEAGDPAVARDQYAELLPVSVRVLGAEHPDTLTRRYEHARYTGQAGDAAEARDLQRSVLAAREQLLGLEHADTLESRHSLAYWTGEAGKPADARDQFIELLPMSARVLGPEHPDTLSARANVAYWTGEAGNRAAARDLVAVLLPVHERVLGPNHPNTLGLRHAQAGYTGQAGAATAARDLFAELLPALERVLGPEHPDTLSARANLARWTGEAGDPAAARDQLRRAAARTRAGPRP